MTRIIHEAADRSWFPRVLGILQRDYPEIAEECWDKAITENAIMQQDRIR